MLATAAELVDLATSPNPKHVADMICVAHLQAWPEVVDGWDFCCGNDAFALELRELARKASAELILCADEVPVGDDGSYLTDEPPLPSRWAPKLQRLARRRAWISNGGRNTMYCICCLLLVGFFIAASAVLATRRRRFRFGFDDDDGDGAAVATAVSNATPTVGCDEACRQFNIFAARLFGFSCFQRGYNCCQGCPPATASVEAGSG